MTDLILRGGIVYDGTGTLPVRADVAITGDRITDIGDLTEMHAGVVIDVTGLAVAPGFIDIHTHSDFSLLANRGMGSSIAQGVTTEVVGNCGTSVGLISDSPLFAQEQRWAERGGITIDWRSLDGYLRRVADGGIGGNIATLAGHGTIRKSVMGFAERPATEQETSEMMSLLEAALSQGAVGLSTGLEYVPGRYADIKEQAALAGVVAKSGGFYATHIRNEGDTLVESIEEALAVARLSGVRLQLSHHKAEGRDNWGKVAITLGLMHDAIKEGVDLLTDQYPYTAYMTGLSIIVLPKWASDGTSTDVVARLLDSATRERIETEIALREWDWTTITIGIARKNPQSEGKTILDFANSVGKSPVNAILDLIIDEEGWVAGIHTAMCDEDVDRVMSESITMIGSDGVTQEPSGPMGDGKTHPRSFGTFPRVLARYVRERGVLTLQEAIRRMTSLPAQRIGLTDRGRLAVGAKADITVFNPATVADLATYDNPRQYPAGIEHVLVNGQFAIKSGASTTALAGQVLRK